MPGKSIRGALGASLKAEEQAVHDRFARAETVLARNDFAAAEGEAAPVAPPEPAPPPVPTVRRDSFTMPEDEYERIGVLQERCLRAAVGATKSEILRAGLAALMALNEDELAAAVRGLTKVKTGRRPQRDRRDH